MITIARYLVVVAFSVVGLGSCTCHREVPEHGETLGPRDGFSAALPTHRRPQARPTQELRLSQINPIIPTLPRAADTPTPAQVTLPDDFPPDVPVYKDAELFGVQPVAQDGHTVLFRVDAEANEVFGYYRDDMQTQGWKVSQEYQTSHQSFLSFQKGKTVTNITVAKDPKTGKQIVAIMYYEERVLPFPEF